MSHYITYYDQQIGGGAGVKNVFIGSPYQRGSGIGSFIGSIIRHIAPYLISGAKAVGKEAVRASVNVLDDVVNKDTSLKESVSTRVAETGKRLTNKTVNKINRMMSGGGGGGYKGGGRKRRRQQSQRKRGGARKKSRGVRKNRKKTNTRGAKRVGRRARAELRSVGDIFGN